MDRFDELRNKRFLKVILFFAMIGGVSSIVSQAEPWVSNRFAQNCAACHAPGRTNRPAKGRRCTLSCQGCHVNPQGGGLRNQYGKWNSQRWLRSFKSKYLHTAGTPAPLKKQPYKKRVSYLGKGKKLSKKFLNNPKHKTVDKTHPDMKDYDKHSWKEWHFDLKEEEQFMALIPKEDPYFLERNLDVYAGADFRYVYGNYKYKAAGSTTTTEGDIDGFMGIDIGLRIRPLKWHKLSFVAEARVQDRSDEYALESLDSNTGHMRSAYVMVDDLAYNTYAQFGNLRPLFGNYNANHESLAQQITGFGGRATFRTVSLGTAPNIPFLIVNYIMPSNANSGSSASTSSDSAVGNKDDGLAVTFGGRWVTMGLSTKISYWSTTRPGTAGTSQEGQSRKWEMYSITAGGTLGPLILNAEMARVERQQLSANASDAGNVNTLEARIRAWREFYLTSSYAMANTTSTLGEGDATELGLGVKAFLVSGLNFEVMHLAREEKVKGIGSTDIEISTIQLHMNF